MDDQELLREYVHTGSQSAFRALVERYIGLVYSAAQRLVQDSQRAEAITQSVFAALAGKADSIHPSEVLARWLYDTTRRLVAHPSPTANHRRGDGHAPASVSTPRGETGAGRVVDALDAMMDKLPPADRDAIVLRFLANRSLPDVAKILHLSEEAGHLRVCHAVEQLHLRFTENGGPVAAAILATALASECTLHVPIGLSIAVSTEALAAATLVPAQPASERWWNRRATGTVFIVLLMAFTGILLLQHARFNHLKSENERLLAERKKFKAEYASGRSLDAREGTLELVHLRRSEDELLRLRREVAQLRKQGESASPPASPPEMPPETPPPAMTPAGPHEPGTYISRAELRFMGYTTPEAAMESIVWCTVAGNYDAFLTALGPEDRAEELSRPDGRELFEARQERLAPLFKGMQVSALKVLADDEVELKVLLDFGSEFFQIQPLVRINEQWRLSSSTRDYDFDWDGDGEIQRYPPAR